MITSSNFNKVLGKRTRSERERVFKGKISLKTTNQYKQQSNFERKKFGLNGRTVNVCVWSSNPGLAKFNPLHLGLSCLIYFFRGGKFCNYRLGFAFYHSVAFLLNKIVGWIFMQTLNELCTYTRCVWKVTGLGL